MKALTLSSAVVASLCVAGSALAVDSFTVNIVRTDGGGNVAAGQSFDYEIRGTLSNNDGNFGLAFFAYDLEATGPSAITLGDAIAQSGGPDTSPFEQPAGFSIDFNGSVLGDTLSQAGGGQNTIDNNADNAAIPIGEVVGNIGHGAGVVLHQGTFTVPEGVAGGEYTLQITAGSLYANMLDAAPAAGPDPVVAVGTVIGTPLTFTVVTDAVAPELLHQAAATLGTPCTGYLDPRFDSSNGTDVDLCFTSWDSDLGQYVPDEIVMVFSEQVRNAGGGGEALTAAAFSVAVTGGVAPAIASVDSVMEGNLHIVTIRLDGPIPVQEWTTVVAGVEDLAGNPVASSGNQGPDVVESDRIDIGCMPGDVNQSGNSSPLDIIRAKQRQLGICNSCPECSGALRGYDIDRKGSVSPLDIIRLKQLFLANGNSTQAWSGQRMNSDQP